MFLNKVFKILTDAKLVIDILVPVVEKLVNSDLNKDGRIG